MKNKILLILFLMLTGACDVCFAQTGLGTTPCNGGNNNPPPENPNPQPEPEPADSASIRSEQPVDPNEIIGLEGYNAPESTDTLRWVSATQSLAYTIYFENDAELAMAAASKVTITVPLHEKLNYATFGVGSFGFGNHIFAVEGSPSSYQTRIDLRDSMGIYLDVVAGLDIVHNEAFWIFQSIDPATGLPPTDIHLGFLPINDSLHSGEGFVTCTIKPKAGECVTGDTVSATASIVFDVNEAIPTNTWVNTIDAFAPTSTLTITPNAAGDMLTATFAGEDDEGGCGVKQYKLYYSVNGSAYQLYNVYPVGDTAEIPAEMGMEYAFFTLAEDNVGNCEPMKTQPEYNIGTNFVTLAVNAFPQEAGTVTGGGSYSVNDTAQLTATVAEGYQFVNWMSQGVPVSSQNPFTVEVTQNRSYTAFIERIPHTILTEAAVGSTITVTDLNGNEIPSGSTVLHFDRLIVMVDTADCYEMESVLLNGAAYVPGDTITVTDNITLTTATEPIITFVEVQDAVCQGYPYEGHGFLVVADSTAVPGLIERTVTVPSVLTGCDSVTHLQLVVNPTDYAEYAETVCDSYTWNDSVYTYSGDYVQSFTNAVGCDSVVTLHLTVNYSSTGDTTAIACDSYAWYGTTYTTSGDYTHTLTNASGCDSVVTLHLTVNYSNTGDTTAIACDSYDWYGTTYTTSGHYTHTLTNANGCDSVVTLHLTVNYSNIGDTTAIACDSYDWYGTTYTTSGDYTHTLTTANGCDSVVTLHLTVNYSNTGDTTAVACDSFEWYGITYTSTGDYTHTLTNAASCDSVVTMHLTVNYSNTGDTTAVVCGSYDWYGTTYTTSGDYPHTFTTANGCDSVVTLHLTVNHGVYAELFVDTCGTEFHWTLADTTITNSGMYYHYSTNANTCTDTTVLILSLYQSATTEISAQICEGEVYTQNGFNVSTAGDHQLNLQTIHGCDSTVILHLAVGSETVAYLTASLCDGDSYNENGFEIIAPEVGVHEYSDTIHRLGTCDSIVTLTLTVYAATSGDTTAVACGSYDWYEYTNLTQSGEYTHTFTNAAGCDSVVTLHLIVNQSDSATDARSVCSSDLPVTWNGMLFTEAGTQTVTLQNVNGCDSVVVMTLSVLNADTTHLNQTGCDSVLWNGEAYIENADIFTTFTNALGCDSVVAMHITVYPSEETEYTVTLDECCYIWNGVLYEHSGTYTQTLSSVHGCDSTVTLHLTITVGIDNHDGFDFKVYPNPTAGVVNVECTMNNVQVGSMEFHVYDAYGKLVDVVETLHATSLQTDAHGASVNSAQIDLSRFAPGVYLLKAVADGNVVAVRKVVKN